MGEREDFQPEVLRGLDLRSEVHYVRIPDSVPVPGRTRFSVERPYDLFALVSFRSQAYFHAIELKQVHHGSFGVNLLEAHQESALNEVEDTGGHGWLVVNFHWRPGTVWLKRRVKLGRSTPEALDVAWALPIRAYTKAREILCYRSLPLEYFEDNGVEIPLHYLLGKRLWDSCKLFDASPLDLSTCRVRDGRLWPAPARWSSADLLAHGPAKEVIGVR